MATGPSLTAAVHPALCEPDRTLLAAIIAKGLAEAGPGPGLAVALGLEGARLKALLRNVLPGAPELAASLPPGASAGPAALEEPDLRALLAESLAPAPPGPAAEFAAALPAILARRCQGPGHLWCDLGLADRGQLQGLMGRHFPALKADNPGMRWKKYLYRVLCRREGLTICKAPNCRDCVDYAACFVDPGVADVGHPTGATLN
ncbi:nitrogen fixation protein NifQ [Roseospirillum parvum]|uniref:Nitrogen fixation protein NifQ n=1 Tax=Roseospirillum parvum TaxID=83401 RepID=A0A1G8GAC9_9PROT|nr:nitrogen fixation protein NifQ [Roseospirillum parvum]SDH91325.1 nitrogen fixation protein NifQ [Roseospirillum parvum]